jgi:ABC-type lipoprotein release transport system permease subunit
VLARLCDAPFALAAPQRVERNVMFVILTSIVLVAR